MLGAAAYVRGLQHTAAGLAELLAELLAGAC
jgi:hypothetical protein